MLSGPELCLWLFGEEIQRYSDGIQGRGTGDAAAVYPVSATVQTEAEQKNNRPFNRNAGC